MSAVTILSHLIPENFPDLEGKTMIKCEYLSNRIYATLMSIGFVLTLLIGVRAARVHFTRLAK